MAGILAPPETGVEVRTACLWGFSSRPNGQPGVERRTLAVRPAEGDPVMRHRIALVVGSVAATATLTVALAVAGFGPAAPTALVNDTVAVQPTPRIQVDTVYVAAPPAPQTITVHRVVKSQGESESEEGGSDD
jgi:hypothetical protein